VLITCTPGGARYCARSYGLADVVTGGIGGFARISLPGGVSVVRPVRSQLLLPAGFGDGSGWGESAVR